jgi:plasmid stabilization system protein ParE
MSVLFTGRARRHLNEISDYLTERNPGAATRVGARIRQVVALLEHLPHIGRPGLLAGTREMVVPGLPYVIVYRAVEDQDEPLVVLGIYHCAQQRPR